MKIAHSDSVDLRLYRLDKSPECTYQKEHERIFRRCSINISVTHNTAWIATSKNSQTVFAHTEQDDKGGVIN